MCTNRLQSNTDAVFAPYRIRQRFVEQGLQPAPERKPQANRRVVEAYLAGGGCRTHIACIKPLYAISKSKGVAELEGQVTVYLGERVILRKVDILTVDYEDYLPPCPGYVSQDAVKAHAI